jgi:hypothetical protein
MSDIPLETAQSKANFCRHVLFNSSGRIILALHPIPTEFLQEMTLEERIDLANTIDRAIRAIKPKTPQAAFSFTLDETVKRILRLGVNKKKSVEKARANSSTATKDGKTFTVAPIHYLVAPISHDCRKSRWQRLS